MLNFAAVNRLDLLQQHLRERGRVVAAVAREMRKSANHVPHLGSIDLRAWFGDEIEFDDAQDLVIEKMRRDVFGGSNREPLKHLGESQTLYLLQSAREFAGSAFLTDDESAYDHAKRQGVDARSTCEILREICALGDLSSAVAHELCTRMWELDRNPLRRPADAHWYEGY